ncbi:MAG TPA: ADP-glyceromanno-heptose 6-epimerase [Leptospiraceae bacterium]|nr:ADP-glyceromanno-heptose 6-epimerase [Leptospiraceae bacterium]
MKHKYIITGGAGLIGSAIVSLLNERGETDILIVDHLGSSEKWKNLRRLHFRDYLEKDSFRKRVIEKPSQFQFSRFIHMGACSSTTEKDASYLIDNNYRYTLEMAEFALQKNAKFIYASSAATYGLGENGYTEDNFRELQPLNMYGYSKQMFDLYADSAGILKSITGLKYFNVFGFGEAHKADMRSVVLKGYEQIKETGILKLFKSYVPEYKDGEQKRDFLYVLDAAKITLHLLEGGHCGLYNVGRGVAETWTDLARALFKAMGKKKNIEFVDMPDYLRPKYQYYTCADMKKLSSTGYSGGFMKLDDAVSDYVSRLTSAGEN